MAAKHASTPGVAALVRHGIAHTIHRYEHDPAAGSFGEEAVAAMGVEPGRVHKTLIIEADGRFAVTVVPVTNQLDLKAAASALGAHRAILAPPSAAERVSGYVLGGISPLGQKHRLPTLIDTSARAWPTIFVSGGRRGLEIELSPADLAAETRGLFVALAHC